MKLTELEKREIDRYIAHYDFQKYITNKVFLITGAKGIVGTGIIKWLLYENDIHNCNARILASTRNPEDVPSYIDQKDNISYIKFNEEKNAVKNIHIDYVIHAASSTDNKFHILHPVESFRINYDGTERMIEIANDNEGCSMIYLSSEEVYGLPEDDKAISEDYVGKIDQSNLRSCYPLSKKSSEFLCFASAKENMTNVKIIRPTVIHGLFQKYNDPRVVNELLRCVIENKNLTMMSDGLTKKCLFYSLDAISAIFIVLFKGVKGEAYNASNPKTYMTVKDLANYVFKTFAPNLKIVYQNCSSTSTSGYLPHRSIVQDISKIGLLGWEPITDLKHIYEIDIERFRDK